MPVESVRLPQFFRDRRNQSLVAFAVTLITSNDELITQVKQQMRLNRFKPQPRLSDIECQAKPPEESVLHHFQRERFRPFQKLFGRNIGCIRIPPISDAEETPVIHAELVGIFRKHPARRPVENQIVVPKGIENFSGERNKV